MKSKLLLLGILVMNSLFGVSQETIYESRISSQPNEKWWGAYVGYGEKMPFESTTRTFDLSRENFNNQVVPLFVSNQGRYVWSDEPFRFRFSGDTLIILSEVERDIKVHSAGSTLRDAYLTASRKHFPPTGKIPERKFFSKPQYNTWIELMYNQNQDDILKYANDVVENGFSTGIFMIDDNWQKYYGNFEFKPEKIPDPKAMTDSLHVMGFDIMLWICPYISPDSPEYRALSKKGYLVKDKYGRDAMINWWNGYSACYDMTNPEAVLHLKSELTKLQNDFGIDGFKMDGGDVSYMKGELRFFDEGANVNDFSEAWARFALHFPFNELRTSWKLGGTELVQRLGDKDYSWDAVASLIPQMTTAGLLGHAYTCPDMIGGGQFTAFLDIDADDFNQELIVRSTQIHAMMPMMQFSVAPWRILDKNHLAITLDAVNLHQQLSDYILMCADHAAITGEPIIRSMEYAFPGQNFGECSDQFMLGDHYLVAPMVKPGFKRNIQLPPGTWKDDLGLIHKGGKSFEIDVPLNRIPYFERMQTDM